MDVVMVVAIDRKFVALCVLGLCVNCGTMGYGDVPIKAKVEEEGKEKRRCEEQNHNSGCYL